MKTTTTTTTTATATTEKNPFEMLIEKFNADPNNPDILTEVASATARAVLKKIEKATADPTIRALRKELMYETDRHNNANKGIDPHINSTAYGCYIGDSYDLVNVAAVAILEEVDRQKTAEPNNPTDLLRPYTIRRLKRKVYIKTADSVNGWEETTTTPIKEVYKAVRRSIDNSRAVQTDPRNGYTYLEDITTDPTDPDSIETIYRRLPKYADIGGRVVDFNGKETAPTTADSVTVDSIESMIDSLQLTDRQKTALTYRMRGYGYKAIATALGIRSDSVRDIFKAIQKKAEKVGLTVK